MNTPKTLLEAVKAALAEAGRFNNNDATPPAAILWTDADGQWRPVVEILRPIMPELLTLGSYKPVDRMGPAIWLRCVIERTLEEPIIPPGVIPVNYLPNVGRQILKAAEECPDDLKPLIELQYRGAVWAQTNGRDWTVEAFLVSEDGGLGLDVAKDQKTRQAMFGSLAVMAATPIENLQGKRLEAEDFDRLMIGDTPRDLLVWLDDPKGARSAWEKPKWKAFCSRCRDEYGFDPDKDGEMAGGERLGGRQGAWAHIWSRFAEAPWLYPRLPELLRRAKPSGLIFDKEPWPDENEQKEADLRAAFGGLRTASPSEIRQRISDLENDHRERRQWVWARLGKSPLALALEPIASLAKSTETGLGGDSLEIMAEGYSASGYLTDDAALRAIAAVKEPEDREAIEGVIQALYLPWLDEGARRFQELLRAEEMRKITKIRLKTAEYGTQECLLFCDGLRFDLGRRLADLAEEQGMESSVSPRWAAWPTVTATAKPAASPVASLFKGNESASDFVPVLEKSGQACTAERLRKALEDGGYQILDENEVGDPTKAGAKAWTEMGNIDKFGHDFNLQLASHVPSEIDRLMNRARRLLDAGWKSVRVITDHGWLLVPGGLPKTDLPRFLVETRWGRCAVVAEGGRPDVPRAPWFWNSVVAFAYARGVQCFAKNVKYAHSGFSLQECVVPEIMIRRSERKSSGIIVISEVEWAGLRCRVRTEPGAEGCRVELRTRLNDPGSRIGAARSIDQSGRAALLVEDEALAGSSALVVVIDLQGQVKAKCSTMIGGNE